MNRNGVADSRDEPTVCEECGDEAYLVSHYSSRLRRDRQVCEDCCDWLIDAEIEAAECSEPWY